VNAESAPGSDEEDPRSTKRRRRLAVADQTISLLKLLATTAAIVVGLLAARPIVQAKIAQSHLERAQADALAAKMATQERSILESSVQVTVLGEQPPTYYLVFSIELRNRGNRTVRLPREGLKASIAPVVTVAGTGEIEADVMRALDLLDAAASNAGVRALVVEPGETQVLSTLQLVSRTGPYVLRLSADDGKSNAYRTTHFFWVK
jgi:hypothetical protein